MTVSILICFFVVVVFCHIFQRYPGFSFIFIQNFCCCFFFSMPRSIFNVDFACFLFSVSDLQCMNRQNWSCSMNMCACVFLFSCVYSLLLTDILTIRTAYKVQYERKCKHLITRTPIHLAKWQREMLWWWRSKNRNPAKIQWDWVKWPKSK